MFLFQSSARRRGRLLAPLLLLFAQGAYSLSEQILQDVDYAVLPPFGPLLTVRVIEAGSHLMKSPNDGASLKC